ncbi:MAG: ATP-binding protein [Acidobacteriota bacterium]
MSGVNAFKIAFIGTHGVGKTTLCYGLAARLKARDVVLDIVGEVARRCPLPINDATTRDAQAWILHTQIADELRAAATHDLVICDRSVLDNYVYLLLAAGAQPTLGALVDAWLASYDLLVHVPIVDTPRPDGLRATDPTFQRAVADRLAREIDRRALAVLPLDPGDRDGWLDAVADAVWQRLMPGQLALL